MKTKLLDSLIFLLITPLTLSTMILLFITLVSTMKFSDKDSEHGDASMITMSSKLIKEQQRLTLIETNFNNYTMNKIEKNNLEIIRITEEINEAARLMEEARERRINNLKKQNTKLRTGLNSYQVNSNQWQSFKTNFSINFKRMGLPFSELFDKNAKQ